MEQSPLTPAGTAAPARSGPLTLIGCALLVSAGAGLLLGVLHARFIGRLQGGQTSTDIEAAIEKLHLYHALGSTLEILLSVAVIVGLVVLLVRTHCAASRRRVLIALWLAVVMAIAMLGVRVLGILEERELLRVLFSYKPIAIGMTLLHVVSLGALAFVLHGFARDETATARPTLWAGVSMVVVGTMMNVYATLEPVSSSWLSVFLTTALWKLGLGLVGFAALVVRSTRDQEPATVSAGESEQAWRAAGRGLKLYGDGLVWRLSMTIGAYVLLFFATAGRSMTLARFVSFSLPVAVLVTGTVMVVGIFRFADQPGGSPGTAPATFAAVVMLLSLFLDLFGLLAVVKVLGVSEGDFSGKRAAMDFAKAVQGLAIWGMALGFASLIALLVAFRSLAIRMANTALAQRCVGIGAFIAGSAGLTVVLRGWLQNARGVDTGTIVSLALVILAAALIAVISYLGLVRRTQQMLEEGSGSHLPRSRVLSG